ncbi:MAG: hypothetical protein A3J93_01135 [Candidatus Magasanikbacteria bacterium RIFOXYC2_FULL_42_28]|uniref:DUF268 domain-containing protein n=1 Tax=Candidatus Magasanikbacteria bacterium RIFOXYC2_FULL_42_28 TaxID=1798704 RepID=A0A1F6NY83_9BACT|nr:MAG: hypothetical protein A3J93_01135 [Candidatus Magasanikbacteria bacterium RIFOXYC2_FULL_42_28]
MFLRVKKFIKRQIAKKEFCRQFELFKKQNDDRFSVNWSEKFPCLDDNTGETNFDAHYIYHPAWAARVLAQTKPAVHTDISSTLHFCSIISAFIPVKFYDYRPAGLNLTGLSSQSADLTKLSFANNSIRSLSCMHTVEHIGLGRYGDQIDPTGDLKAISELKRVLSPGGDLLFVVPIGKPKLTFNAHRIYSYEQIIEHFFDLELKDFSLVLDNGDFINSADLAIVSKQSYGCGCFWFKKKVV